MIVGQTWLGDLVEVENDLRDTYQLAALSMSRLDWTYEMVH
jgi:hypothetical protein